MSSDYGFSLTTFSPTGKLVQIEYALNAVAKQGRPALGIKTKGGVVIATEKKVGSSIVEESSLRKVEVIDSHVGCVYSGMPADFRVLLARARKEAAMYRREYDEPIPVLQLVKSLSNIMQEFTQSGGVRPFGCSLFVAGFDAEEPKLYQVDPSGTYFGWKASAIGRDCQSAKMFLEKRCRDDMSIEDAIHTALLTLKELCEGVITETNIEVGVVYSVTGQFRLLRPTEVKDYLAEQ